MVTASFTAYASTYAPARKDAFPFAREATRVAETPRPSPGYQLEVSFEDFRDVAVIALEDIVSLLRVASEWADVNITMQRLLTSLGCQNGKTNITKAIPLTGPNTSPIVRPASPNCAFVVV